MLRECIIFMFCMATTSISACTIIHRYSLHFRIWIITEHMGHSPPICKISLKFVRNLLRYCKVPVYVLSPNGKESHIMTPRPQSTRTDRQQSNHLLPSWASKEGVDRSCPTPAKSFTKICSEPHGLFCVQTEGPKTQSFFSGGNAEQCKHYCSVEHSDGKP